MLNIRSWLLICDTSTRNNTKIQLMTDKRITLDENRGFRKSSEQVRDPIDGSTKKREKN